MEGSFVLVFVVDVFADDAVSEDLVGEVVGLVVEFFERGGFVVPGFVVALAQVHGVCVHEVRGDLVFSVFCFGEHGVGSSVSDGLVGGLVGGFLDEPPCGAGKQTVTCGFRFRGGNLLPDVVTEWL